MTITPAQWVAFAVAAVLTAAAPAAASAQPAEPSLTLDEARSCLCLERTIDRQRREAELQGNLADSMIGDREAELARLDRQIAEMRATMDVNDQAAIEGLKRLLARQQELRGQLRPDLRAAHRDAVAAVNAAIADYNQRCAARHFYALDADRMRQDLQCPPAP
jgi:capsule polysaccharide export protein KpsE/RkpR